MITTGYMLREALRRWGLLKDSHFSRFGVGLSYFPGDPQPDPTAIGEAFNHAEDVIAALQMAQARYNLLVKVDIQGRTLPLGEAVKRIGGAGRYEKMWRDATGAKKDRFGYRNDDTRKTDEIRAIRTVDVDTCLIHAKKAAKFAGDLRAAIATGNATKLSCEEIGLDPALLEE